MIRQTVIRTPLQITPPTSKVTTSSGAKTTQGISVRYSSLIVTVAQNTSSSGKAATSIPSHVGNSGLRNASAFYNSTQGPATAISFEISCASSGNGFNTTQVTPSEKKFKVRIANNDNIANHSGQEGGQNLKKTQQPDEGGIQQIQEFFKSKGCIPASFDEEVEEFIFKNPADTQESMKHDQVLNTIETTLMSISITAEVISFAFLSVIRVPKSERIFVHKNLLVSLALGQLVYVLDVNNFPTRNVHHANLGVFIIVLRVSFGKIGSTSYLQTTRKGLKAIFALLPLLGVTFLLGFIVEFHAAVEYAYVLLNSIQVRDAMNKVLRKKKHNLQQFKHEPKKVTEEASKKA
ncbi:hypothetical protein AWC38_SpisGene9899 [Stylophora pistillata]|uniref:Uncharacterized protein n=1 Tax=Stylophora pistillata TaxID=50429 RepID=A0A2B4S8Y0_STYPI|nr:hypothetical protein AWC38_SpisGene9899 [Stylophora pistillata]